MSAYKAAIQAAMKKLAADPARRFMGYNVANGRAGGTLDLVDEAQLIEMPVAENLVVGAATGLALCGYKPVVWIERADFVCNAMDALNNHLDKLASLSQGQFNPAVIVRLNVGGKTKPLYTGITHTQDLSEMLSHALHMPVMRCFNADEVTRVYDFAATLKGPCVVTEFRDSY